MFIDTVAFQEKMVVYKAIFENQAWSSFTSYREMQIQLGKLGRMTDAFRKKYPAFLLLSVPRKKLDKMRGADVHRVNQQLKVVERLGAKLIEEQVVSEFQQYGLRISKRKVRGASQRFMQAFSDRFHKPEKALDEALGAVVGMLKSAASVTKLEKR